MAEERTAVTATLKNCELLLYITPVINGPGHHDGKRLASGVSFEIASRYAEKVGGTITQRALRGTCVPENGACELPIARYPELPLRWNRVCKGFAELLLRGGSRLA